MNIESIPQFLGLLGAVVTPICNIPLIARIVRRKSSQDISLAWVLGVEFCIIAMLPASIISADPVLKIYGILNFLFFSAVTAVVWIYRAK